ncbi:helix-turn-helix transcriptional regulator [Pendulispora brunnea]|uniref:Helix-turn-helix transcriptional regulator n=1 Tax=Pendulispora brunnea TaxID=2905690 RepID=A0ABZ2KEG7_9BACT
MALKDRAPYAVVEDRVGPAEVMFHRGALRVGQFRCSRRNPWFTDSGPTSGWLITFPRLPVLVAHAGEGSIVADPSIVKFFNRGQEFRREALCDAGDRCEWFSFDVATVAAAVRPYDPAAADRPGRPFALTHAPVDSASFLLQRRISERVMRGDRPDILDIEEALYTLLAQTVAHAYANRGLGRAARREAPAPWRLQKAVVDHIERTLATRYREPLSLDDLAKSVGYSPFHLAHVFRAHTGTTIHAKRMKLRMHVALEEVRDPQRDLTDIALDLGFSSHSHFTESFRRTFGQAPRAFRSA